jgi:hypothetical protein
LKAQQQFCVKEQFHQLCGPLVMDDDFGNGVPFRGKCQGRPDMYFLKFRVIFENFLVGHTRREPAENIAYGNAGSLNTGLSKTYSGINGDIRSQFIHGFDDRLFIIFLQVTLDNFFLVYKKILSTPRAFPARGVNYA